MRCLFSLLLFQIAINSAAQLQPVGSVVFHWNELPVIKKDQRESRKITEGTTFEFAYFEIHATTQEKGAKPKPAHAQPNTEELIIIKEGQLK